MIELKYGQLREILALTLATGPVKMKLEELLSGKASSISEGEIIELIFKSEVDKKLIKILTKKAADEMDAAEAIGVITDFFDYMRANLPKFASWLRSSRSAAAPAPKKKPTRGKNLK